MTESTQHLRRVPSFLLPPTGFAFLLISSFIVFSANTMKTYFLKSQKYCDEF